MIYLVSNTRFDHPQVRQLAVCKIEFLKFSLPAQTGALIFTSKNAVAAIKFNEILPDLDTPVYAIFLWRDTGMEMSLPPRSRRSCRA